MMNKIFQHKTCFIDLDGTMYRGDQVIEGAIEFIDYLIAENIPFYFLTNNAMRTHKQNREKMEKLGFHNIQDEQFFTSAMAAASYMKHHETKRRAFMIGEEGMSEALLEQGFTLCKEDVELVFVGLDSHAEYETYCEAFYHLQKGAKLIGTNSDRRLPHKEYFHIGNGAIVHMLEYCSEQKAIMIGKPYAPIMEEALRYANVCKDECLMIGDNLETDVMFGLRHDVDTIFVTTGVHTRKDLMERNMNVQLIIDDLRELIA